MLGPGFEFGVVFRRERQKAESGWLLAVWQSVPAREWVPSAGLAHAAGSTFAWALWQAVIVPELCVPEERCVDKPIPASS